MKLVLKNQQGENWDLEILPGDTFLDVQKRLLESEKIAVDLATLASPHNKPFSLSSNVMEYFGLDDGTSTTNAESRSSATKPKADNCEILDDVENIPEDILDIYMKAEEPNDSAWEDSNIKENDSLPPQENKVIEPVSIQDAEVQKTEVTRFQNLTFPEDLLAEPAPLCRLCAQEIFNQEFLYLHEPVTDDGLTLADKINTCLPITVGLEDQLPKQVCCECLSNLDLTYMFSTSVTSAEEKLLSMEFGSKKEEMNCPLCCEGCMEVAAESEDDSFDEAPPTLDTSPQPVFTSVQSNKIKRKRKKRDDEENDKDWSLSDDLEPAYKKHKSKNRGRPKGSKNYFTKIRSLDCFICSTRFKDYSEALEHTLGAHCDSVDETFPCPLCQTTVTTEQELRDHIQAHSDKREVLVIECGLCEAKIRQTSEVRKHMVDKHLGVVAEYQLCPLCRAPLVDAELVPHMLQLHTEQHNCPVCSLGCKNEEELKEHLAENHIEPPVSGVLCVACDVVMTSQAYLTHVVDAHCTTLSHRAPCYYTCPTCNNNFRNQYFLVRHTCQVHFDDLFCRTCDRGFPTKTRFVFHLYTHTARFPGLRCDECLQVFTDEDNFYDHVRFQHEADEQLTCEVCHKVFKNAASLNMHMKRHDPNREHECKECRKRFQNAQTLREHLVSHMAVKPFRCHICGAYLSRLSRLRIHLRTHSVKSANVSIPAFKCSVCNQLFPSTKLALKHTESHSEMDNINLEELIVSLVYRCEFCDGCFQKPDELNSHRKDRHTDPDDPQPYACSVCGAAFSTFSRVATHKLSHGINTETLIVPDQDVAEPTQSEDMFLIPQYFLCHECDKRSLHYTYLGLHRRFQHCAGKPVFSCSLCNEKFATSWSLTFHKKLKHNIEGSAKEEDMRHAGPSEVVPGFVCSVCEKPYLTESSVQLHFKRCHQPDLPDSPSSYICETCGKIFQFKSALEAHADAHKGLKRFGCNTCYRRFTHRAGLIRHMKLHSEDDPFVCDFCGKKFRDRTERENHMRAHTGERPFMCDVCGRTFHTRAVWLDHYRIHQDIRPYQCDICNQSFRRSYALKSHYLIHTGERPFACDVCGKAFRLKQTLGAHKKKEHGGNSSQDTSTEVASAHVSSYLTEGNQYDDNFDQDEMIVDDPMSFPDVKCDLKSGEVECMTIISEPIISPDIVTQTAWKTTAKTTKKSPSSRTLLRDKAESSQAGSQGYSLLLKPRPSDQVILS